MTDKFKDWDSEQPQVVARRSTSEIFGGNLEDSLSRCKPEDLEYNNGQLIFYFLFGRQNYFFDWSRAANRLFKPKHYLVFYNLISSKPRLIMWAEDKNIKRRKSERGEHTLTHNPHDTKLRTITLLNNNDGLRTEQQRTIACWNT